MAKSIATFANFSRGSHSGGTNREIGILKFTPDNLVSYEESNSK